MFIIIGNAKFTNHTSMFTYKLKLLFKKFKIRHYALSTFLIDAKLSSGFLSIEYSAPTYLSSPVYAQSFRSMNLLRNPRKHIRHE